ncbi:thioesterase-like superfamily-domain-containing protein [Hygrophoropsis aurantiaca]|uniref:Thioesterase-like superfamily-domain-containing protein n=1 Tax=Hygrophoropsis aurantiaca TaxID=72124 RepID=A0ACB8A971_9AGAM|nr:thioesterase-like superfamily-domain-containing protein [Hygrophoropsis aurantiaca]
MSPLSKALQAEFVLRTDEITIYRAELSETWKIGSIPQGGYALGVALDACIKHQTTTPHKDLIHVTAHFLHASNVGVVEVHIKTLKLGKGFTNLSADIIQQGRTKITAHVICGDLSPDAQAVHRALVPPSPYARRLPLPNHPSLATPDRIRPVWGFQNYLRWSRDKDILTRNSPDNAARTDSNTIGGGGVEWGAWCELTNEDDKIVTSSLPFFGDTFQNLPFLLPETEKASQGASSSWFPTMTMTVEFKARISSSPNHSNRTVGLYCESHFLGDPQGRHNARVEVWTAPSGIGQGKAIDGWRDEQYCIAVADQMALTIPMDINRRQGTRDSAKL